MKKVKYLNLDDRLVIEKELLKGKSFSAIGRMLGKANGTVNREVYQYGKIPYNAMEAQAKSRLRFSNMGRRTDIINSLPCAIEKPMGQRHIDRTGKLVPLSLEERHKIYDLFKKGYSSRQIAKQIGRGKNTINAEIRINGGNNYCPIKAHENAKIRQEQNKINLLKINLEKKHPNILETRVENLEMQVELLYTKLKELINK